MDRQSNTADILSAWRALAGNEESEGWRTIPVTQRGPCRFLAGRHFPGNEEALLVGFSQVRVPTVDNLPNGRGFKVVVANPMSEGSEWVWIALCRQRAGSLDFFAMMAADIVTTLEGYRGSGDEKLFNLFLARIKAWQDFMRQDRDSVLSPEAELGLWGEIEILRTLISAGTEVDVAIEAWVGPVGGIQDFRLGTGAIEVKSTLSPNSFPASINSLEQLDDSLISPIFLAGIRLTLTESGRTLPEQVAELRDLIQADPAAQTFFGTRLLQAGFLDGAASHYVRRFSRVTTRLLPVSDGFPRLTRATVAKEISRARYEIDIDLIPAIDLEIKDTLKQLGVIQEWN